MQTSSQLFDYARRARRGNSRVTLLGNQAAGILLLLAVGLTFLMPRGSSATDSDDQESKASPQKPLQISLVSTAENASRKDIANGTFGLKLTIKNVSDQEVLVWPFVGLQIEPQGAARVKQTRNISRWGRLSAPSKIESVKYLTLKPGAEHAIKFNLNQFNNDIRALKGWSLSPGQYQLDVSYRVERARLKKRLGKRCQTLNDPEKPWNQVVEVNWNKRIDLKVTR